MTILFTYYVRERLNRIRNILLYNLLIDLNTRIEKCNTKIRKIYARVIYIYNVISGLSLISLSYLQ